MVEPLCRVSLRCHIGSETDLYGFHSYDALKKLFPSNPLDPSYLSTQQHHESTSMLPLHSTQPSDKWAGPEEFRQALDRERDKVTDFYKSKYEELHGLFDTVVDEVETLEAGDMGMDDTIQEENEDDADGDDEDGEGIGEGEALLSPQIPNTSRANPKPPSSMLSRLAPAFGRRRKSVINAQHEADILEASMPSSARGVSRRSVTRSMDQSGSSGFPFDEAGNISENRGRVPLPKRGRRPSSLDSEGTGTHDRRTSMSSNSSHEHDLTFPRRRLHSLGLVQMDPSAVPSGADHSGGNGEGADGISEGNKPVYIWTANDDYGTLLRISLKKRISAVWLEVYALKQYVALNFTAFEKILKK